MIINVTNSRSILGHVASVCITKRNSTQSIYLEISDLVDSPTFGMRLSSSGVNFLLGVAHRDASVQELRNAIATTSDFFTAEATLGDIARLLEESFWARLDLEVGVEFAVTSTGHGIIEGHQARILLSTKEVA